MISNDIIFTKLYTLKNHARQSTTSSYFSKNNKTIDVFQNFNYLGFMLDANMSWKAHIAMVRNKLSRVSRMLYRL